MVARVIKCDWLEWIPVGSFRRRRWGQWAGKGGSVAAALAPAGWVVLLEVHTSVPAWSTSCILGLILGELLSCLGEEGKMYVWGTPVLSPKSTWVGSGLHHLITNNEHTAGFASMCQVHSACFRTETERLSNLPNTRVNKW